MALPPGLALSRSTGQITGVPTTPGTYTYTLRVRDAQGAVRDIPVTQLINPYDPPVIGGTPAPAMTRGVAYAASFTITGGLAPFTWSISSGSLPAGVTINASTGAISGTPTATTGYNDRTITARVVDSLGSSAQRSFPLRYRDALSVAHTYPIATRNEAYSSTPALSGGHSPFVWKLTSGSLPSGLALNATTGRISGTPTSVGSGPIVVNCTDAAGNQVNISQTFTVVAAYAPVVLTGGMTDTSKIYQRASGVEVIAPTSTLQATGGSGTITYSWERVSGSTKITAAAPSSKNTGFNCTAAAGESASALFRLTATDGTSSDTYEVTISGENTYVFPSLSGTPDGRAMRSQSYSSGYVRSGGVAPFSWSIVSGTLPTGVSINSTSGTIAGIPLDVSYGVRSITVRVTDGLGQTAQATFSLDYRSIPSMSGVPADAYTTQAYSFAPSASGGFTPYAFEITSGTLPVGLSLNPATGVISGTPTQAGDQTVTMRMTDDFGATVTRTFAFTVISYAVPSLSGSYTGTATRTKAYSGSITRSGGLAPFTFNLQSGTIPTGLTLDPDTGAISGTPTATSYSNHTFTVRVTDALGNSATTATQTIVYRNIPTFSGGGTITRRVRTESISHQFTVNANAHTPVTFTAVAGSLPTGAVLNASTGALSGTLTGTSYGTYNVTVRATDAVGNTVDATCSFAYSNVVSISVAGLPNEGGAGLAYSGSASSSGGFGSHSYSVVAGSLPAGLSLNASTGAVSGTPSAAYNSSFTIRATDADGRTAQAARTVQIYGPFMVSTNWAGGTIARNAALSVNGITASNGKPSVVYSVLSGSLPAGVSLNASNGNLSGTVTGAGSYSFRLRATDALGRTVDTNTISGAIFSLSVSVIGGTEFRAEPAPQNLTVTASANATVSNGSGATLSWTHVSGEVLTVNTFPTAATLSATLFKNTSTSSVYRCTATLGGLTTSVTFNVALSYSTDL